jgi:hypothetical protein
VKGPPRLVGRGPSSGRRALRQPQPLRPSLEDRHARPAGESSAQRPGPAENLVSGMEFAVGEFVLELVPQLQHSWWRSIEGRLGEPRFYDFEQYLLPGRL